MSIRKELTAQNVLLGFQHVLVSNVWLDPVFVAGAIGLPIALSSNMINAIFIVSGLVTLVQATRLVRLPVVQGPSAAFDALMIAAGTAGMLGAASSSILIASLVFLLLCLTGVIERMRFLFSPMISGVVIFMVGVSLSGFTLSEFLGGAPGDKTFADPHILTVSILTTAIVLVLSLLGKGLLKSFSFLIALVVGTVVAAAFGMVDFSPVASKGWLGLPTFLPYGPFTFDWKIFIPFFIAYMVAVMEALGVYQAASEIQGTSLERKQVRYGLAGEAAGSAISSLIGGFTTTAYPQNVGLLNLTGEGKLRTRTPVIIAAVLLLIEGKLRTRTPVIIAAVLLLILGFVPKAGALLSVIPSAVVGGIFLPAAASLIVTGLRALRKVADDERRQTVIGMSLLLGIALPKALSGLTGGASVFFGNNIMVGVFSAIILNALFVALPDLVAKHRAPASVDVPAADPADGTGAAAYDER